ncbi:MAG TPA: trigger factor [Luteimonas sp.]|nr:trigger factor [Luteimonas sp.]
MAGSATQVSVESTGNLERRMTLRVPAGDVDSQVGGRLREIARTARIKGFRPGKVPATVVEQRFGQQVRAEVLDGLLRQGFDSAVRENDLRIAGSPRIEPDAGAGEGELSYVATFELMPDFGPIDVSKLQIVRHSAEVTEADVDRMVENLRQQRGSWTVVERAAKEGDAVDVATWSQAGDTRLPAEGEERGAAVIGSGVMYVDIEKALAGMKAGESKTIDVDFPADWRVPMLAGRTVQVHLSAERVSERVLPEVDGAFIRSFGVRSGELSQFRSDIRSNLERELKGALMGGLRREVGEALAKAYASTELPPRLVEQEARALAQQAADGAAVPEDAYKAFMEPASKRVLLALLVAEVARQNELRLDPRRVNELMRLIASTYEEPQQVIDLYRNDPQLMAGLQNRAMEEQVIDWIAERATHTDKALTFQEAIG